MPKQPLAASGLRFLWLTLLIVVIDQFTKQWVIRVFDLYERVAVLPHFNLTYVRNHGAAFSFLADQGGWQRYLFTILAFAISAVLVLWLKRNPVGLWRQNLAFALIIGGAIGNVIDRLIYGYVIDFFDVYVGDWHWPAFNVADAAITVGAALMLLEAFFEQRDAPQSEGQS